MSYCRCSDKSDLYIWYGINGLAVTFCRGKEGVLEKMRLNGVDDKNFEDRKKAIDFLYALRELGFSVSDHAIERLETENW